MNLADYFLLLLSSDIYIYFFLNIAVPRLLNRIHDAIYNKVRGNIIKKYLLRLAYQSKRRDLKRRIIRTDTIWDMLVFNKVRASLGGRVRLICVGSAPLSHNVLDFLRCALGCVVSLDAREIICSTIEFNDELFN